MENAMSANQRVCVLIDDANIFITANKLKVKVDYGKVIERLNTRQIIRAIMYYVEIDPSSEFGFVKQMRKLGIEPKSKKLKTYADGKTKGDMDVDIAVGAISLANKCDVITIVSCDSDFVVLLQYLKGLGVKAEAMGFEPYANVLKRAADEFYPITKDMLFKPNHDPDSDPS